MLVVHKDGQAIQECIMKIALKAATIFGVLALTLSSVPASAQDGRLSISFTPAVVTGAGDGKLALAGMAGYRFSDHFSFEGDVTWIDDTAGGFRGGNFFGFDTRAIQGASLVNTIGGAFGQAGLGRGDNRMFDLQGRGPGNVIGTFPALNASTDGKTWIGTMGVRYEPSTQTSRFRPYVSGGLGVNFTDQSFSLAATSITPAIDQSSTHSGLALSAGGGANIHLGGPLWAAADAKYFHLSQERDLMRLGGGLTLKF